MPRGLFYVVEHLEDTFGVQGALDDDHKHVAVDMGGGGSWSARGFVILCSEFNPNLPG